MVKKTFSFQENQAIPFPKALPRAILFDWDNTLVDTWQTCYDALNVARAHVGLPSLTPQDYWNQPHLSMRDSGHHLFGDAHAEGIRIFYESIAQNHLANITVHEGAESLLHHLKKRDIYLGVVSNKEGDVLRKEVAHLGWKSHFHQVIGSKDTEADKPSHVPVLAALKPSLISPSKDVWFVGDSIVDVQCARAAGCLPFVVGDGGAAEEEDVIHIKDCHTLTTFIERLPH